MFPSGDGVYLDEAAPWVLIKEEVRSEQGLGVRRLVFMD